MQNCHYTTTGRKMMEKQQRPLAIKPAKVKPSTSPWPAWSQSRLLRSVSTWSGHSPHSLSLRPWPASQHLLSLTTWPWPTYQVSRCNCSIQMNSDPWIALLHDIFQLEISDPWDWPPHSTKSFYCPSFQGRIHQGFVHNRLLTTLSWDWRYLAIGGFIFILFLTPQLWYVLRKIRHTVVNLTNY